MSSSVFLSRILGLLRDQVMAFFFGTTFISDAFNAAFNLPNLLRRLFGEGALSAAFVPIYNEIGYKRGKEAQFQFAMKVMLILSACLLILTGLGVLLAPVLVRLFFPGFNPQTSALTIKLTRILFPYLFCIGLSSTMIAILNSHDKFFMTGLSSGLLNIGWIGFIAIPHFLGVTSPLRLIVYASYGVMFGGIMQILINLPFLKQLGYQFKVNLNDNKEAMNALGKRFLPGIIGVGVRQINLIADNLMASFLPSGSIAALMFGNRLMQLPLGIFGIATGTAVLPLFSQYTVEEKWDELSKSVNFALLSLANIMIPITIMLIALGDDFVRILFQRGEFGDMAVAKTYLALLFYSLGLFFFSVNQTLIPLFYANKDTKTPVIIAASMVTVNITLNYILMQYLAHGGLALSTSITSILTSITLFVLIRKRYTHINFKGLGFNLLKIVAICMVLLQILLRVSEAYQPEGFWMLLLKSALFSSLTFTIYVGLAILFKVKHADYLIKTIWRRFHRN